MLDPSTYFSDQLSIDLGVNTDQENPLSLAFRESLYELKSQLRTEIETSRGWRAGKPELVFRALCLETENLSATEKNHLLESIPFLSRNRNLMSGVERLAQIYFGKTEIRRGWPLEAKRFTKKFRESEVTLSDHASKKRTIFIRTRKEQPNQNRVDEFTRNLGQFLEGSFEIRVHGPILDSSPKETPNYSRGVRL